jgi:hypothetical protein
MFPSQFDRLMAELRIIAPAIGRGHLPGACGPAGLGHLVKRRAMADG